jgi:hypothetical protein
VTKGDKVIVVLLIALLALDGYRFYLQITGKLHDGAAR